MIAIQPKTRQILGVNQQSYQALKSSMALNLRRQLLIAVCDNVAMQNQLASQLETDLAIGAPMPLDMGQHVGQSAGPSMGYDADDLGLSSQDFAQDLNGQLPRATAPSVGLERLVFDPEDGNLPKQVANWVRQTVLTQGELPQLQVVGIEQMTRQPAITQNHFLRSLEKVEALLPRLNTSLLIWLPWPWLRTIQQSAPTFWNWRSGIFEFVSDPIPADIDNEVPPLPPIDLSPSEQADFALSNDTAASAASNGSAVSNGSNGNSSAVSNGNGSAALSHEGLSHEGLSYQGVTELSEGGADWLAESDALDQQQHSSLLEPLETGLSPRQASNLYGDKGAANQTVEDIDGTAFPQDLSTVESSPVEQDLLETNLPETGLPETGLPETDVSASELDATLAEPDVSHLAESESGESEIAEVDPNDADPVETVVVDNAEPTVVLSTPAAKGAARRPQRRRRNVGVLGGLRSVVSKGVNAASASSEASPQVVRSPEADTGSSLSEPYSVDGSVASTVAPAEVDASKTLVLPTDAQQRATRQKAADDYFAVGMVYRTRIENGERGLDLIEPAIAAYEGALGCLTGPHPDWGSGLNDLGTLYWLKAQQINDPQQSVDCMTHSIQLYQEAIDKLSEPNQPADRQADDIVGQLYSNMGAVYTMLATHDEPTDYLNQAAATYLRALELYTLESDPEEYATLQNSMGSVYWQLSHYDSPIENLRSAIQAYNEALRGYEPVRQPLDYAAVQNNVGITYWSLAKHERPTFLLKHAIAAYRDALNYRTPEVDPGACAITYNNLALAYWDLSKEGVTDGGTDMDQKSRYQQNAVTAFEAALNTSQAANSLSQADGAAIFHCLGDVHAQMVDTAPSLTEVSECLQKSLYSYLQAIEGVSPDSPLYQGRLGAIVANLKSHYDQLGLSGQQSALNRIPPEMLSQVMLSL